MKNDVQKIQVDDLTIRCFKEQDAPLLKEAIDSSLEHLRTYMDWAFSEPKPLQTKIDT